MESVRIIIAMNSEASILKLKDIFLESGHLVIDQAKNGQDCLRKIRVLKPDILVVDYDISSLNGYEVAKVAIEDKLCDVVLFVSAGQENLAGEMSSENGFICMTKPLNRAGLKIAIDLMIKNRRKIIELEKEIVGLKASLDARKEVERAKGLLMTHLKLTEVEAFRRIQKQSMDKGIPMKDIAKAIILAYDI